MRQPSLASLYAAAARGVDLSGDRADQATMRLIQKDSLGKQEPHAVVGGINIHAAVAEGARDRPRMERMCGYLARPPIAQHRLTRRSDGSLRYDWRARRGSRPGDGARTHWLRTTQPEPTASGVRHFSRSETAARAIGVMTVILKGLKRSLVVGFAAAFVGACRGEAPATEPNPDTVEGLPRFQEPLCDRFGQIQLFGQYMVQNNIWNSEVATQTQCVTALWDGASSVAGLVVDPVQIAVPGQTAGSYPAIVNGWHWGKFHGSYLTARTLGEIAAVHSTWRFSVPENARFSVEYDLWLHPTAAPPDPAGGLEVMIWVAHRDASPIGEMVDSIELEGATWEIWSGPNGGFTALTYRRAESVFGEVALDLRGFLDDASARGGATPDWYLLGVEAGFELWRASSPFTIDAYELRIE